MPDGETTNVPGGEITNLLNQARMGDGQARDKLFELVYGEVRKLAAFKMQGQPVDHTLQPTALANEAIGKILQRQSIELGKNRIQFFALAALAMRSVLVDYARRRNALKRSSTGSQKQIAMDAIVEFEHTEQIDLISLDESLHRLEQKSIRQHEIVMLHFFGGLQFKEIAEHLEVSKSTVEKDWHFARAWLRQQMNEEPIDGG